MASDVVIIKPAEGTLGCSPEQRTMEQSLLRGIVIIDKPKGPTSHEVSETVKKILSLSRAGHSGTLDPAVTGVLPVALSRGTRIVEFLLIAPKEYVGVMHLHEDVEELVLRQAVEKFVGKITQLPPVKSAVKRQLREREVYAFELLERKEKEVLFRVQCQAGTYVRKLIHDLGQLLGGGAHMAELRRTHVGPFTEKDLVTLTDLKDAVALWKEEQNEKWLRTMIQPIERAVEHLPKVWVLDSAIESITHGRDVAIPGISKLNHFNVGQTVAVMTLQNELLAVGKAIMHTGNIRRNQKGIAIKVEKVFMDALGDMAKT